MVDWNLAAKVAEGVAALQPAGDPAPFQALVRPADEAEALVSRLHGADAPAGALPVAEAVDRDDWIDANLALDPRRARSRRRQGRRRAWARSAASSAPPPAPCSASRPARSPASSPAA